MDDVARSEAILEAQYEAIEIFATNAAELQSIVPPSKVRWP